LIVIVDSIAFTVSTELPLQDVNNTMPEHTNSDVEIKCFGFMGKISLIVKTIFIDRQLLLIYVLVIYRRFFGIFDIPAFMLIYTHIQ